MLWVCLRSSIPLQKRAHVQRQYAAVTVTLCSPNVRITSYAGLGYRYYPPPRIFELPDIPGICQMKPSDVSRRSWEGFTTTEVIPFRVYMTVRETAATDLG
jgi:hypothetical protein